MMIRFPKMKKPEGQYTVERRPSGLKVDNRGYNDDVQKRLAKVIPFNSQGRRSCPALPAAVPAQVSLSLPPQGTASFFLRGHEIPKSSSQTWYWPIQKRLPNR
jgi:hypothetical protein